MLCHSCCPAGFLFIWLSGHISRHHTLVQAAQDPFAILSPGSARTSRTPSFDPFALTHSSVLRSWSVAPLTVTSPFATMRPPPPTTEHHGYWVFFCGRDHCGSPLGARISISAWGTNYPRCNRGFFPVGLSTPCARFLTLPRCNTISYRSMHPEYIVHITWYIPWHDKFLVSRCCGTWIPGIGTY